jgi:hypothetical protein
VAQPLNRRRTLIGLGVGLGVVGVLVLLQPFSAGDSDATSDQVAKNPQESAVKGLCTARAELRKGNRVRTYDVFYSKAHVSLHVFAAQLDDGTSEGKASSSKLRVAKSKVEQEINIPTGTALPGLLDALIEQTSGRLADQACS